MASNKYWACFLLLFGRCSSYENLCRKPDIIASQSSDRGGFPATKAVDWNNNHTSYLECSHTAPGRTKAWFQVDLRRPYRVNSLAIYYRNEINWKPYRFRQFYLDVSNTSATVSTTLTPQRVRCYTDNTTYPATPPSVIDIPCKQTAQYVIIETTYSAPENPQQETGAILEICEIDIFGCRTACFGNTCYANGLCNTCGGGHWGQTCQYNCPSNCYVGSCDKYSGSCNRGCEPGFWGVNCTERCSAHCLIDICDYNNETCINGCKTFFTGDMCQSCISARYGEDCEKPCSVNCMNGTCHGNNGTCTLGCDGSYFDAKCKNALSDGIYISNSKQAIYIGSVTGIVVFLLVVMVLIHYFRSRKRENIYSTSGVAFKGNNYDQLIFKIPVDVDKRERNKPQARNPKEEVYENNL